jgi:CubicO group peptidase (beta-lactamase class C family)
VRNIPTEWEKIAMSVELDIGLEREISTFIEKCLQSSATGAVGLGIAVVADGRPVFVQGYGHADLNTHIPYSTSTIQNIGSLSKAFLSTTVAWLVSQHKLDWSASVRQYLPEFALSDAYLSDIVTVRDMMASRIATDWPLLPLPHLEDYIFPQGPYSASWLRRLARAPLDAGQFRSEFRYDGGFMGVAAILIERVTGLPLADVQHQLFVELGMKDTSLTRDFPDRVATHYQRKGSEMVPISDQLMRLRPEGAPAGGMRTSISDYARWIQFHLGILPQPPITAALLSETHRPHITIPPSDHSVHEKSGYSKGQLLGYGLGWRLDLYADRYSMFHGGSNPGIRSFVRLVPSQRFGIAVFQNSDANDYLLARHLIDLVYDYVFLNHSEDSSVRFDALVSAIDQLNETRIPAMAPPPAIDSLPPSSLLAYTGTYCVEGHCEGEVLVKLSADVLHVEIGTFRLALHPWRGDLFHCSYLNDFLGPYAPSGGEFRDQPLTLHFLRDGDGQIASLKMSDEVDSVIAQRRMDGVVGISQSTK